MFSLYNRKLKVLIFKPKSVYFQNLIFLHFNILPVITKTYSLLVFVEFGRDDLFRTRLRIHLAVRIQRLSDNRNYLRRA